MELVDITPEDSEVPIYLKVLSPEEQSAHDAEMAQLRVESEARENEQIAREEAKISGLAKLMTLGLTEQEAKSIIGIY